MEYTPNQIKKLQSLGINVSSPVLSKKGLGEELDVEQSETEGFNPDLRNSKLDIRHSRSPIFPLLSISGLTILSFSGLILFKTKSQPTTLNSISNYTLPQTSVTPTQVPKSIQHYLLTSQQYFSQASQLQNESLPVKGGGTEGDGGFESQTIELLNQSILAATDAIKEFPSDYRGFYQRGRVYQSILASQPQLLPQVIADLAQAQKLAPDNAEITRSLASAYAQGGDAQNTINFLSQTIALEPTKAQNFYDLAKIQQQVGLLPQALETYKKLITLVSDSTQKSQVEIEKSSLEKLISQNPKTNTPSNTKPISPLPTLDLPSNLDSPTIQASTNQGLIVATPQEINKIEVSNLSTSNSLSGLSILPSNQKQVVVNNDQVSTTSQIYLTVTKGGKNQNLQVLSKTDKSFTVGLDSSISEDIEFKWWIIN